MPPTINYPQELNPRQLEAVQSTEGPHLIIAGAGSGKTRVLVFRTAYLVEQGVDPSRILLLTFTRKASAEMLERATAILDDRCQHVSGGTFHSFANNVLRRHGEAMGLPRHFTILDQDDAENAVNLVRTRLGFAKGDKKFPKKDALLSVISKSVNKATDIDAVVYDEYPHFAEWIASINQIRDGYEKYKRDLNLLDYDDLLVFCDKLLAAYPAVCQKLSEYYQYVMVDEYQDTNRIQAEIVRRLAGSHNNVMVVGDDSQSIYSFRGAHFRNIIDFPKLFPGTKTILLEQNYRSSQPILDLTNEVISAAAEKFDKSLFTTNKGSNRPVYVDVIDENSQSRYIVNKVLHQLSAGVPLHDIAILFRSGWHSNDLEIELASQGIPFVKYGGQKFVESSHVKDILSFLRAAYNPDNEVAWLRVLTLLRGIGEKTALKVARDLMASKSGSGKFSSPAAAKSADLQELIKLYNVIDAQNCPPAEILKPFMDFYYPLLMEHYDDYDKRINDLESLDRIAVRYTTLEAFLTDMALEPPEKTLVDKDRRQRLESHLVLSTIHSAKGLEWNTVFVIHLSEGYLPSYRSTDNSEAIEEERRLFYVATTRAKEHLYLLRPQIDSSLRGGYSPGGSFYTRVSRFLEEGSILTRYVTIESDRYSREYAETADDNSYLPGFD